MTIMDVDASSRRLIAIGCILAGIGVAAGAFGAHMLKTMLEPPMLAAYDTATRYQMYHAFGMILAGMAARLLGDPRLVTAGWIFALGMLMFCGSLYGIALAGLKWMGPITPLGGLTFIIGWGLFGWRLWRGVSGGEKKS
jgi:uncharacterized membrane protein YgdD (TMEM256/DUF423 family)